MNTRIEYRYKNAAGYVDYRSTIIEGELQLAQLTPYAKESNLFIPGQVGLPALNGKDLEVDGPYHEMLNLDLTQDKPENDLTAVELLQKFKVACEEGWSEMVFYEEIAAEAAEACNRFVVQVPEALINTAEFEVIMQSSEFGEETFKHFSLDLAFETILKLYAEALKLDDGVERTIGLLLNPAEKETVLTILRGHFSKNSLKVLRNDLEWACSELRIAEPQLVKNSKTGVERAFNDSNNFDLLHSFLKQKELLVFS